MTTTCSPRARRNLESQGFARLADDREAAILARAAAFQPRATLVLLAFGVALAAAGASTTLAAVWFGTLAVLAWLGVASPPLNVFDRLWAATGQPALGRPPAPRRFSQGIAATFLTAIALLFALDVPAAAFGVASVMAVAAGLASFAEVCIGSALYHLVFGRAPATR